MLCTGITVYSPMKRFRFDQPGMHIGVVGLGGLGHVAVKFGKAFGMRVTVISTSPKKEKEAIEQLGADGFFLSSNPEQIKAAMGTMDGIIDTVAADHALAPLILLLKVHGKMVLIGIPEKPLALPVFPLLMDTRTTESEFCHNNMGAVGRQLLDHFFTELGKKRRNLLENEGACML